MTALTSTARAHPVSTAVPRPKPIHPWTPGSVRPVRLRPGPRDASHERTDLPTPIRELAEAHGVRWYRDACGDDGIPGRWGEIFRLGVGRLGVQIGGPRANNTMTDVPVGSNTRILAVQRRRGWPTTQRGDGEAIFSAEDAHLVDALRAIGAYRKPKGGTPPNDPAARARGLDAMRKRLGTVGNG